MTVLLLWSGLPARAMWLDTGLCAYSVEFSPYIQDLIAVGAAQCAARGEESFFCCTLNQGEGKESEG